MTDETNTNRWTAKVIAGKSLAWLQITSDDEAVNTSHLPVRDAESLAEQINRPAPTATGWTCAKCGLSSSSHGDTDSTCVYEPYLVPTTPADDLPPGVERISDGTLWAMPHAVIPDDYDARSATGGWGDPNINRSPNRRAYPCEVRPVTPPEPDTEWVPWWEALRDAREVRVNNVAWIACTGMRTVDGIPWVGKAGVGWAAVRSDGMVEVQR